MPKCLLRLRIYRGGESARGRAARAGKGKREKEQERGTDKDRQRESGRERVSVDGCVAPHDRYLVNFLFDRSR